MAGFFFNNTMNINISHTSIKLNCGLYLCITFENKTDLHSIVKKLAKKLKELISIY